MHTHRTLWFCMRFQRLIRPFCCFVALIHPLIHGTVLDGGALDALVQYGMSNPSNSDH